MTAFETKHVPVTETGAGEMRGRGDSVPDDYKVSTVSERGKKFGNGLKINQRLPIKPYSKFILGIAQKTLDE